MPYFPPPQPAASPGGDGLPPGFAGYRSGKVYSPYARLPHAIVGGTSATQTFFAPFTVEQDVSITELYMLVTTVGGNAQMAFYANNVDRPGGAAPLARTPDIDCSAGTTVKTGDLVTAAGGALASLAFTRDNFYWLGFQNSSAALRFQNVATSIDLLATLVGVDAASDIATGGTTPAICWFVNATTYGTWPDLTSATLARTTGNGVPAARFKVA